jgi:hypothetical protein
LSLHGTADELRDQLGGEGRELATAPDASADEDFVAASQDPTNVLVVKRIAPREHNGVQCNVEIYREDCPLDINSVAADLFAEHGGRKFRFAVYNSAGAIVAARVLETAADPIIPGSETPESQGFDMTAGEPELSPLQKVEVSLKQQTAIKQAHIDHERLTQEFEDLKSKRQSGAPNAVIDAKIFDMEKKIAMDELRRQYDVQISEMKSKLEALSAPKASGADDKLLGLLMEQQKESNKRFETLVHQMQDNKLNEIQRQLERVQSGGGKGNAMTAIRETIEVARAMGWSNPNDDEDGEPALPESPQDLWKALLKDLINKHLPRVFDIFEERVKQQGLQGSPTREETLEAVNRAAAVAAAETVAKMRAAQAGRGLPQPQPAQGNVPPPVVAPAPAPGVPAPTPVAVPVAPPAPAAPVEDPVVVEVRLRAAACLAMLRSESKLRAKEWEWTGAWWSQLPADILDQIAVAPTPAAMLDVFVSMSGIKPEAIQALKSEIGDEKTTAWVAQGLEELRAWVAESRKDPKFDPFADEPDEGGA